MGMSVTYQLGCGFGNPPNAATCNGNLISGATGTSSAPGGFSAEIISASFFAEIKAEGSTGVGTLGVRAKSETGTILGTPLIAAADASLTLDDVIFSSPDSDPILVALNLNVSGSLFLGGLFGIQSKAIVGGFLNGTIFTGEFNRTNTSAPNALTIAETKTGLLSGLPSVGGIFDSTITTANISVPVNVPVSLKISLDVLSASGGANTDTYGQAHANMLNTLSFATGGNVFTLPSGFTGTVNSIDGGITNNSFGATVPLPAATWLFVSGLLGLIGISRRKKAA